MKLFKKLFPLFLSICLIIHFFLVSLTVMPMNPISNAMKNITSKYVDPLFTQNWHLFAPDPIENNTAIQMKIYNNKNNESEWIDATTKMTKVMHNNYVSPYNRIARMPEAITSEMLKDDPDIIELKKRYKQKSPEKLKILNKIEQKKYNANLKILNRYSSAYIKAIEPDKYNEYVKIRILEKKSIPFSQRNKRIHNKWKIIHETKKLPIEKKVPPLT
jgi:hypothetical protein